MARKITAELNDDWIDFENIFANTNSNSNVQAYSWYVLGKLIARKPDQYKNKLRADKGLELWIVGEL